MTALRRARLVAAFALQALAAPTTTLAGFVTFESGHVRPLALSPDGGTLLAVNTPDCRLSVFAVTPDGLALRDEIPVGLEPVAVDVRRNLRGNLEAWVVDHLSDSVSVIEFFPDRPAHVTRVLHVGDEPRDVLIAGHDTERVFITTAHRGQHRPTDPQLTTPGVPRADVWVFDAESPGPIDGGTPLTIVELFGDTPRALARTPDGRTVYVAVFNSGNGTTTIPSWVVTPNGGLPPPPEDSRWFPDRFPPVGLIVKADSKGTWRDELGRDWSAFVPFSLPDYDVFAIDADAPLPTQIGSAVSGVGTTLYALAVRPGTGDVFVANVEARNHIRFEPRLRGHVVDNRVTVIGGGQVRPVDLNPHIDREARPGDPAIIARSLAIPAALTFSGDGAQVFVAALGSQTVARLDAAALASGTVAGAYLAVGAGPSGLVLDQATDRLYVMNQLDHTISVISGATGAAPAVLTTIPAGYDPTPEVVRRGRPFLYDARISSAYGDASCASCHVFGDMDHVAWDLGDPYGRLTPNRNKPAPGQPRRFDPFHPMKGPMMTQSLRGLANAGPMHWRGDRTGADVGRPLDERAAFTRFNRTFVDLLGRAKKLRKRDMRAFTDFILTLRYPPNPVTPLEWNPPSFLSPRATEGADAFNRLLTSAGSCSTCHAPIGDKRFGPRRGRGANPLIAEPQQFKAPHLRNMYQKIGAFGVAMNPFGVPALHAGPQVRGFGFLHDGSVTTLRTFLEAADFDIPDEATRDDLEQLMLEMPTGFLGHVGVRLVVTEESTLLRRLPLLYLQCVPILHTVLGGRRRGLFLRASFSVFVPSAFLLDSRGDPPLELTDTFERVVLAIARMSEAPVTCDCVPLEIGVRLSIDRDEDRVWDADEADDLLATAATAYTEKSTDPGQPLRR